jgi:predicted  nucleic acid-binding Zn-ribbon protein
MNSNTNTSAKTLLNLQSLEFTSEPAVEKQERANVFIESIHRLRSSLSIQVLEQYDFRKQRYGSNSVVPVKDGACSGCHVALSTHTQDIAKDHVVECEHCGRLLYNPERRRRVKLEIVAA